MILDEHSCEGLLSELDLFHVPPTQTSVEKSIYKTYHPINAVTANAPLEFHITNGEEDYLDLHKSFYYLQCQITKADGTAIAPANPNTDDYYTFPINDFVSTQFKNIEVYLNGTLVSPNDNLYAYRSYFEDVLSYGSDAKDGFLRCGLFIPDVKSPDLHNETVDAANCTNPGARARFLRAQASATFDLVGKIHSPLFNQPKVLLNKMDLRIKFHRHDPKFSLMSKSTTENFRINISQAKMYVLHKKLADSVRISHETAILSSNAKYPISYSEMKFYTRPANQSDLSEYNLATGILPKQVILGLVSSEAFNGSHQKNPLAFNSYTLDTVQLLKNGESIPFSSLEMDYTGKRHVMSYISLLATTGKLFADKGLGFSPSDFNEDAVCLYGFDLSQDNDSSAGNHISLLQEGTLDLHIKLSGTLTESVTLVVYLLREGLIEIDKDRNVTME